MSTRQQETNQPSKQAKTQRQRQRQINKQNNQTNKQTNKRTTTQTHKETHILTLTLCAVCATVSIAQHSRDHVTTVVNYEHKERKRDAKFRPSEQNVAETNLASEREGPATYVRHGTIHLWLGGCSPTRTDYDNSQHIPPARRATRMLVLNHLTAAWNVRRSSANVNASKQPLRPLPLTPLNPL